MNVLVIFVKMGGCVLIRWMDMFVIVILDIMEFVVVIWVSFFNYLVLLKIIIKIVYFLVDELINFDLNGEFMFFSYNLLFYGREWFF